MSFEPFEITDAYAAWFLEAERLKREAGYQCKSGNIPGAPGAEIYREAFLAVVEPKEANQMYFQAEQVFLASLPESTGVLLYPKKTEIENNGRDQ